MEIPAGGITALTGPSGSGKSTVLRCCNLLESPTSGRITYQGEDLADADPLVLRRDVAMVFQRPTVFPGSALDNLRAGAPDLTEDEGAELLAEVGLSAELLHREADNFSGGEAQRLCLARALTTGPQVVLADEVTSALDDEATAVLENLVRTVLTRQRGISVLWVSHSAEQVERIADRVIRIESGTVVA
ncbi:MAG TPA: ATP-binding cassette domain-containing protein [Candidatus Corynebacterium avicola]|uniref:ATP-binding cassette domain-containing protein n=1 Tax=Candidatus Corynebacterium avicola TaxID=2838527 RepID=A0A9D1UKD8_9CORY|nr:ATP-binding cassette domain-containing protein [Candidatus Corynebacterium avicola]